MMMNNNNNIEATTATAATAMIIADAFKNAVQQNNHAVRLLQAGCYHEASITFQRAIQSTRAVLKKMKDGNILPTSNRFIRYQWSMAPPLSSLALSATTTTASRGAGDSFVFRRALSIIMPPTLFDNKTEIPNIRATSTIFLFNLGLSFHLEAAATATAADSNLKEQEFLEKALGCYRVAMTMRNKYRKKEYDQLFDLALANNVAEIHRLLHNYQEASVHYEIMKQHTNALHQTMLTTEDVAGFIFNLACFAVPRMASAA